MDNMDKVKHPPKKELCRELGALKRWACVDLTYIEGNDAEGKNKIRNLVEFLRITPFNHDVVSILLPSPLPFKWK